MFYMSSCQIPSNPDIDGIGIRVSLYLQTLIIIFIVAASPKRAIESWWSAIVSAVALQVTGFISASGSNLTLYHALLITWLTCPMAVMVVVHTYLYWDAETPGSMVFGQTVGSILYLSFLLWVWTTTPYFGPNPECNHTVKFAFMAAPLNPLGPVRYVILYIVGVWTLIAAIAVAAFIASAFLVIGSRFSFRLQILQRKIKAPRLGPKALSDNRVVAVVTVITTILLILSITMAELMIHLNNVSPGSGNWSYGQIVSMILLAGPLFTLQRTVREELHHSNPRPLSERPIAYWYHRLRLLHKDNKVDEGRPLMEPLNRLEQARVHPPIGTSPTQLHGRKRAASI